MRDYLGWPNEEESEQIADDVEVVAVLPHPESMPENASPAYYCLKRISSGTEIQPSEVANLSSIAGQPIQVSYNGDLLPHVSAIFPEENNDQQ
jgi:hypothetical protein